MKQQVSDFTAINLEKIYKLQFKAEGNKKKSVTMKLSEHIGMNRKLETEEQVEEFINNLKDEIKKEISAGKTVFLA